MTIEPDLMRSVEALSQPHPVYCDYKPDLRKTRSRRLRDVCHPSHVDRRFERRSSKFGGLRDFTSGCFCRALKLKDNEFEELIAALAVIKKFNN